MSLIRSSSWSTSLSLSLSLCLPAYLRSRGFGAAWADCACGLRVLAYVVRAPVLQQHRLSCLHRPTDSYGFKCIILILGCPCRPADGIPTSSRALWGKDCRHVNTRYVLHLIGFISLSSSVTLDGRMNQTGLKRCGGFGAVWGAEMR